MTLSSEYKAKEAGQEAGQVLAALNAVGRELPAIGKNSKNPAQGWKYRSAEDILNNVNPIFFKHGLTLTTENIEVFHFDTSGKMAHAVVKVLYRLTHTDGSFTVTEAIGEAKDSSDKTMGKAMTYALKTMLNTLLLIPSEGMDPDAYVPTETDEPAPAPAAKPKAKAEPTIYKGTPAQKKKLVELARMINPGIEMNAISGMHDRIIQDHVNMADLAETVKKEILG